MPEELWFISITLSCNTFLLEIEICPHTRIQPGLYLHVCYIADSLCQIHTEHESFQTQLGAIVSLCKKLICCAFITEGFYVYRQGRTGWDVNKQREFFKVCRDGLRKVSVVWQGTWRATKEDFCRHSGSTRKIQKKCGTAAELVRGPCDIRHAIPSFPQSLLVWFTFPHSLGDLSGLSQKPVAIALNLISHSSLGKVWC